MTWWVVVGDKHNNLLGLKKASVKKKVNLKIQIEVPSDLANDKVYVYLMADSYIGLDQVYQVNFFKWSVKLLGLLFNLLFNVSIYNIEKVLIIIFFKYLVSVSLFFHRLHLNSFIFRV